MKILLKNRALLKISGEDAESFLQNQLSNDISAIEDNKIQLNAYCTHQGKIIVLFKVFKNKENYFLDFPKNLLDIVEKRLKMFVLMSKVEILNVTDDFKIIGTINKEDNNNSFKLYKNISICYLPKDTKINTLGDNTLWQKILIENKIPEVELSTTEKFTPQMLNLDLEEVNGVSWIKGCYPGQEVIARLHYLGKAKRRLFQVKTTENKMKVGDVLFSNQSKSLKKTGIIVSFVECDFGNICLATLEISQQNEVIYLNNADGAVIEVL
ncbi:Folate-dependent protein for Fe/S cluster synthesis/repair in oxidative stress [hydrothermal vent metagenome]|uniref:Folate-dependent protein for Fe/S cluster synthesis/repair in oxidative stress n=1 Tax=hydrothermal vent metagenome TaxID=652676 RepID=A0A1W1CJX9_9ZZZZ